MLPIITYGEVGFCPFLNREIVGSEREDRRGKEVKRMKSQLADLYQKRIWNAMITGWNGFIRTRVAKTSSIVNMGLIPP